jgi:alpha-methylacyl-CoA racemase
MGPLKGIRIIEIAGIGPGPFAGMVLADMGAEVIRVERPGGNMFGGLPEYDYLNRGKRCIAVNLKTPEGVDLVLKMAESADAMLEGFRPGVVEKLGIGPDVVRGRNSKLVYGRMTGWGQNGPMAQTAGHDVNYISIAGALHPMGQKGSKPMIPLSLVGDFGGGGLVLAYGMVCALLEAKTSGEGQVVDAAMVDGAALLMTSFFGAQQVGYWNEERGSNMLDSGAPYYDTYECADGEHISVGAIEPKFYAALLDGLGLADTGLPDQNDQAGWPVLRESFTHTIKLKTRDQWAAIFEGKDACVAPVLKMSEVPNHPHIKARNTLVDVDGNLQPGPAPRFSRTEPKIRHRAAAVGEHTDDILKELGLDESTINTLRSQNAVA